MGKLSRQIEQAVRRRAKAPRPQAEEQVKLTVSDRERDIFTNAHATMLLELESILVQIAEQDPLFDDHLVEQGLRAAIRKHAATEPRAQLLVSAIDLLYDANSLNKEHFQTAMRVIYTSLKIHSDCEPGDRDYLNFAAEWVKTALWRSRLGNRFAN